MSYSMAKPQQNKRPSTVAGAPSKSRPPISPVPADSTFGRTGPPGRGPELADRQTSPQRDRRGQRAPVLPKAITHTATRSTVIEPRPRSKGQKLGNSASLPVLHRIHKPRVGVGSPVEGQPATPEPAASSAAAPSEAPATEPLHKLRDRVSEAMEELARLSACRRSGGTPERAMVRTLQDGRMKIEMHRRAVEQHLEAKALANEAWGVNARCDVLHRYRSGCHSRQGAHDQALHDARRAMTLNPASGQNFLLGARVLQQNNRHSDSGASYLVAMRLGIPAGHGDLAEARYAHLLDTIRRRRDFGNVVRPQLEKRIVNDQQHRYPHMWDPRKVLDDGQRTAGGSPDKPELELRFQGTRELHFAWQEPYDGGDEIYEYILHAADYDCKWQEKTNSFFDGFRPWRVVHQGPAAVREFKYKGLKPANQYQFRLVARNSCGSSDECEKLFETAGLGQPGKVGDEGVPKSWLKVDLGDIMASYVESSGRSVLQFVQEISGEIGRFVGKLRLIFKLYCPMGRNELDPITFRKFMKDCGLIKGQPSLLDKGGAAPERRAPSKNLAATGDGGSPAGGGATADGRRLFEVGCKQLAPGEVDLLFQRATTSGLQSRSKKFAESQELAGDIKDQVDNIAEMLTEGMDREGKDEDNPEDDEDNFMQIKEFVGALVRVAWTALPHCKGDNPYDTHWGMGARLGRLLDQVVMPAMEEILNKSDPLARVLERGRVRAVLEHYDKDLHAIFSAWAAADQQTTEARQSADSVNLPEFLFLLNQGKLIDANLTLAQATSIFAFVNMQSEQEEGGDEDMGELVYDEFVQVIARCCDAKIPEANRGGEAFEYTLQTWLEYQVVPIYRALIKDRKRGIAKATL